MDNPKNVDWNRLAIYFFYDKDGIVDDYVPCFLKDLSENLNELLIVCNGKLTSQGRTKFEALTPNILVRENVGFDVWAYKAGLEHCGWDKLAEFDEVVLIDSTLFGPVYPFHEMFTEMEKRDVDFWGITKHHQMDTDSFKTCKYGYIPEHIQSSFLVIRRSLMANQAYHLFWDKMPMVHSYEESVGFYEAIFTKDFVDMGFRADVFVNTEDLREYTRYPLLMMSLELVKNRKCPVIKRKSFYQSYFDMLSETIGRSTVELYDYIKTYTNYDVNLIWDNILRTCNMVDIKNMMHLNFILPTSHTTDKQQNVGAKTALMIHLYFEDEIESVFSYARAISEDFDVYITTNTEEKKKQIEQVFGVLPCRKLTVLVGENRGRDVGALLVGCKNFIMDYDYVCFVHDKKTTQIKPLGVGEDFSYKCFENLLPSQDFVHNVLTTFEQNPRLGLLAPPPPNHGHYYQTLYSVWANNYENTCRLAKELNIRVEISSDKEPVAPLGTMFWFRPKALKMLFDKDWKYTDFPPEPNASDGTLLHAVERLYGYAAQDSGYYCGWLLNDKTARIELTNLYYMLHETVKNDRLIHKDFNELVAANWDFIQQIPLKHILKLKLHKKIPPKIWGAIKKVYFAFRKK